MTQTIIEIEFGDAIGRRRNKRMIDNLKDQYVICGFGRIGRGKRENLATLEVLLAGWHATRSPRGTL